MTSVHALSRKLAGQLCTSLVIYTASLAACILLGKYLCSLVIWQGTEPLYLLLLPFVRYPVGTSAFLWILGAIAVFALYWRKALTYTDVIADVSAELVDGSDELIHLPEELKIVEDRMNRLKQEAVHNARAAKEAEQRKNDLIVYLAHDLKTPLTSVIGYLTLLRDERQISPELQERYLGVALSKAQRLEELINEFFDITRFNLSRLILEPSRVNLSRMLEQIVYEFRPILAEKGLACRLVSDRDVEVECDVNKLERVIDNLIRNAVSYSYENSEIDVILKQYEDCVSLQVSNRGNTIPKEKLEHIFEQFYRVDASRGSRTGGAGLGLAIAREIVELHHGRIEAQSSNQTIVLTVTLPLVQPAGG